MGKVLLVLLALVVIVAAGASIYRAMQAQRPVTSSAAHRHAQLMARLLDLGLHDPMYRQSRDWEAKTTEVLESYYRSGAIERRDPS